MVFELESKNQHMEKILLAVSIAFLGLTTQAFAQQVTDTVKLNKQLRDITGDIAKLNIKLEKVNSDLPLYRSKADAAIAKSHESADESSDKASDAKSGNLKKLKRAKKAANRAQDDAEDAKNYNNKIDALNGQLTDLTKDIAKKTEKQQAIQVKLTAANAAPATSLQP